MAPTGGSSVADVALARMGLTGDERFVEVIPSSKTESSIAGQQAVFNADLAAKNDFIKRMLEGGGVIGMDPTNIKIMADQLCPMVQNGTYRDVTIFIMGDDHPGWNGESASDLGSMAGAAISTECPNMIDEFLVYTSYM